MGSGGPGGIWTPAGQKAYFGRGKALLREFGLNSRHPGPRRVWKGGSELQLMTPDCGNPLDPADPAMNTFLLQLDVKLRSKSICSDVSCSKITKNH